MQASTAFLRRAVTAMFAVFVGLSLSFSAAVNDPENDGELIEEAKVVDVRFEHRIAKPFSSPPNVACVNHVYSCGDHLALPHRPLPIGHCLANGLRAPLRC